MEAKYIEHDNDDLVIVNAARVSFNKNSGYRKKNRVKKGDFALGDKIREVKMDGELFDSSSKILKGRDAKLIRSLWDRKHISCFYHNVFLFDRELSVENALSYFCESEIAQFRRHILGVKGNRVRFLEKGSLLGYAKWGNPDIWSQIEKYNPYAMYHMDKDISLQKEVGIDLVKPINLTRQMFSPRDFIDLVMHYNLDTRKASTHKFTSTMMKVDAPIFVARQDWTHKIGFSRNEQSRRYLDHNKEKIAVFWPKSWRGLPPDGIKQGSSEDIVIPVDESEIETTANEDGVTVLLTPHELIELCIKLYEQLINIGLAPEQARMFLSQNMSTSWRETSSLYDYGRVNFLRAKKDAQAEIRDLENMVDVQLENKWGSVWGRMKDVYEYGR